MIRLEDQLSGVGGVTPSGGGGFNLSAALQALGNGEPVDTGVLRLNQEMRRGQNGILTMLGRDRAQQKSIEAVIASIGQ